MESLWIFHSEKISCKVSPDYNDNITLLLQATGHIISFTCSFQPLFYYTAPPSKRTRTLQWLVPISINQVTYLKTRAHLCLFEKCILIPPLELPKETLRITAEISQDAHGIKTGSTQVKTLLNFYLLAKSGEKQFSQEAS